MFSLLIKWVSFLLKSRNFFFPFILTALDSLTHLCYWVERKLHNLWELTRNFQSKSKVGSRRREEPWRCRRSERRRLMKRREQVQLWWRWKLKVSRKIHKIFNLTLGKCYKNWILCVFEQSGVFQINILIFFCIFVFRGSRTKRVRPTAKSIWGRLLGDIFQWTSSTNKWRYTFILFHFESQSKS